MQLGRAGLAALAAVLLAASACAAPFPHKVTASPELPPASPSASPTPTAPLAVSPVSFHGGEVGVAYAPVALSATGGLTPYKWSVASGALPGGLAIGNDGSVAGTPTTAGTFSFTIQVTDATSSTASLPAASMAIAPAVTLGLIASCAQYCRVELGCDSTCGAFGQVSGGAAPYNYSFAGGQLPAGTSLNGLTLNGTFKGQSGWVQFTAQVTDAFGGTASVSPKFWMYDHISLTGGTIPTSPNGNCSWNGAPDPGCIAQFPYSGGTPNSGAITVSTSWVAYSCGVNACPGVPPMPTITLGSGLITVSVPRGYSTTQGYKGTLAIKLTNQDTCAAGPTKCSASANVTISQTSG